MIVLIARQRTVASKWMYILRSHLRRFTSCCNVRPTSGNAWRLLYLLFQLMSSKRKQVHDKQPNSKNNLQYFLLPNRWLDTSSWRVIIDRSLKEGIVKMRRSRQHGMIITYSYNAAKLAILFNIDYK